MAKTITQIANETGSTTEEVVTYLHRWGWMRGDQITDLGVQSGVFQPIVVDGAAEILIGLALNNLHPISNHQIITTSDGHLVESRGEAMIDEWLSAHRIKHEVQVLLPFVKNQYLRRADFYLPDQNLYIEYWGGNTPSYLEEKERRIAQYDIQQLHRIDIFDEHIANLAESPLKFLVCEEVLRQKLREYRAEQAKARGGIAHFRIFEDSVLNALVAKKPRCLADFSDIKGIGKQRLLDFGNDIANIVIAVCYS